MGLSGAAAIAGIVELKPQRHPAGPALFTLEQWAELAQAALADAAIPGEAVDGVITGLIPEASLFAPATVADYLGMAVNFAEIVDLGGATAAGMVWRAAAAIELGIASTVLCVLPAGPSPLPPRFGFGASSGALGSPQAEFEIPYGYLGQNAPYAMIAQRYAHEYGYDPRAMAKIAVDQRTNACAWPDAAFHGRPLTIDDVLASPMIAEPLHMLEIVMPLSGGAGMVVTRTDAAARGRHRPVRITGFGERLVHKTPTYSPQMLNTPIREAADQAFAMAGRARADIDMAAIYDCYTITVLMTLEDAGFCPKGEGARFIRDHDLTWRGDFPMNTCGGQLSFGQAGFAGGMHHICDAVRQIRGTSGPNQVRNCDTAFVSGTGGIMSEQLALILEGA